MLKDIRKRRSKITNEGNWFIMKDEDLMGNRGYDEPDWIGWVKGGLDEVGQNADFVANAPRDIDTLLSLIDRYETALKEITRWYGFDGYRINCIVKEALEKE